VNTSSPKHIHHRWAAVGLAGAAAGLELAGGPSFVLMLLLAAAGAQWAIVHCVRERELDEPVLEAILTELERQLTRDIDERR